MMQKKQKISLNIKRGLSLNKRGILPQTEEWQLEVFTYENIFGEYVISVEALGTITLPKESAIPFISYLDEQGYNISNVNQELLA